MSEIRDGRDVRSGDARAFRRKQMKVIASVAAITLVVDFFVLKWVVPIAEEMTTNPYMSLGYIVTFLVVFSNFIIALLLIAFVLHQDSYPSDRWT